jgi:hypothetical protein
LELESASFGQRNLNNNKHLVKFFRGPQVIRMLAACHSKKESVEEDEGIGLILGHSLY